MKVILFSSKWMSWNRYKSRKRGTFTYDKSINLENYDAISYYKRIFKVSKFKIKLWKNYSLFVLVTASKKKISVQFSHSIVSDSATPWTAARQASLSITNCRSPPKPMSIESVMPSNHLILCYPLLLPSVFPSIRVFSNESALCIIWPEYWSFSFNISPSNERPGLISFRMDWFISLQSRGPSRVFSNTTVQKHQFFSAQLSL